MEGELGELGEEDTDSQGQIGRREHRFLSGARWTQTLGTEPGRGDGTLGGLFRGEQPISPDGVMVAIPLGLFPPV